MLVKNAGILVKGIRSFIRDEGFVLAGSVSFFSIMAFVPFCLFLINLTGHYLGEYPEFRDFFLLKIRIIFPEVTQSIINELIKLISYKGMSPISLLLYAFLSFQAYISLEHALNVIFKVNKKRNIIVSVLSSLIIVTLMIAFLLLSFMATSGIHILGTYDIRLPYIPVSRIGTFLVQYVFPFLLIFLTATAIYFILPRRKVMLMNALKGGLFTSVLFEIAKHVFTWYVKNLMKLGRIYGPLTAFFLFLLWVFYSSTIFLVGAEIVSGSDSDRLRRGVK